MGVRFVTIFLYRDLWTSVIHFYQQKVDTKAKYAKLFGEAFDFVTLEINFNVIKFNKITRGLLIKYDRNFKSHYLLCGGKINLMLFVLLYVTLSAAMFVYIFRPLKRNWLYIKVIIHFAEKKTDSWH